MDQTNERVEELQDQIREEQRKRTELERRCQLLEKMTFRDPSSGLRTETYLHARVTEEIERSIRYPSSTTLLTLCAPDKASDSLAQLGHRLEDELRNTDQIFELSRRGLAILLVETPEDGAHKVLERIGADLEQFIQGYGYTVTSFPVDANLADDFIHLALERHNQVATRVHAADDTGSAPGATMH
jgi:GGDEF domain-containing protein